METNHIIFLDREGKGFVAENPDEPSSEWYGFFVDEIQGKIILWVESFPGLSEEEAIREAQDLRQSLLRSRRWGSNHRQTYQQGVIHAIQKINPLS